MSGIEVVGIVLGVVPLLISAIEHYDDILGPLVTFRKYSIALRTFTTELNVQRDIFQNECIWLLSPFTEPQELEAMLKDPSHHLRRSLPSDKNLNSSLQQRLGPSYTQVINILQLIRESLNDIYEETKDLSHGLDRPVRAIQTFDIKPLTIHLQSDSSDLKAWRRHVSSKMKLSLGQRSLNDKLNRLRFRNQAFLALSEQILRSNASIWTPGQTQWDNKSTEGALKDIKILRESSDTFHRALEGLSRCSEHKQHTASIRLCFSIKELFLDSGSKLSFGVALLCKEPRENPSQVDIPKLLTVECDFHQSSKESENPPGKVRFEEPHQTPLDAPNSNKTKSSNQTAKPTSLSRVRMVLRGLRGSKNDDQDKQDNRHVKQPYGTPPVHLKRTDSGLKDLGKVSNLCKDLLSPPNGLSEIDKGCIGYFKEPSMSSRFLVYDRSLTTTPGCKEFSLSSLLAKDRRSSASGLSISDKWRLAGMLSMSVLLYHSTAWLSTTWTSNDILFYEFEASDPISATKLAHLHSFAYPKKAFAKDTSDQAPLNKNELIHRLGIMLLELEFGITMPTLEEGKISDEVELLDSQLLPSPLLLLRQRAGEQMGTVYGRIVRMCLDCDFGLGLEEYRLDDPEVQKVFYARIVRQLQDRMEDISRIWG
jgi:hypothetical protein